MTAISYHDTVNDLHGLGLSGKGPFARVDWFRLLEAAGHRSMPAPLLAVARDGGTCLCLPLVARGHSLSEWSNWYAFTWQPLQAGDPGAGQIASLAQDLARSLAQSPVHRATRIEFGKLPDEDGCATQLENAFREAGWIVWREACDTNHYLRVQGRDFASYLATRPGPLRTTLKRKAKKVEVRLADRFSPEDWECYEEIYRQSWKPEEGDPALLRAFAEQESALGHFRFALALADAKPVAAQFWTVEQGIAYIHKLAHVPEAERLSPGTTLTAALMEQAIDRDGVEEVDFGTGNDRYKADWMENQRPRYRLTCMAPASPRNWPAMAKKVIRTLVSPPSAG